MRVLGQSAELVNHDYVQNPLTSTPTICRPRERYRLLR